MIDTINKEEQDLELDSWLEKETHQDAVDMINTSAVVPFGTSLWPV